MIIELPLDIFHSNNKMSGKIIGDPEKFELASIVTKNSRTGITSNRRLLVVRAGHLYYYSNVPKSFTGDNFKILQQFHQLPKCSIEIININRINGFQPSSSYFSIEFDAKNMLERQDIRKTLVNEDYNFTPKNTKELVTWQFTCDNQFIKQKWVSSLQNLKEYFKNEQINMQKYFQSIHQPVEEVKSSNGSYSSRSSLKVSPWRQSAVSRKSYTLDNNKYGFQFRQGSPKQSSNRIQDQQFLKKGKSDDIKLNQVPQFQMIIKQEPSNKATKIQDAFKVHQVKKEQPAQKQVLMLHATPIIEQSVQQASISQTPIKENSYSDSEDQFQYRSSRQKTLNDLRPFSEGQKANFYTAQEPYQEHIIIPTLAIVQQKPELKKSKHSAEFSLSARSNIQEKYSQTLQKTERQPQSSKTLIVGSECQWFLGESLKRSAKFEDRLQKQKELISLVEVFKQRAIESFSSWLESKANNQERYLVTEQSNHIKLVDAGNIQLKVAVLSTQNITINGKQKIFFNEEGIKNLKRQFKVYQNLFKLIMKQLKTSNNFSLRVPLAVYIEYKGATCIAFDQCQTQTSIELSNNESQQWTNEKGVLSQEGYKLEWFTFKTINDYLFIYLKTRGKNIEKDEENFKEYLKKIIKVGSAEKNHNIIFQSPIDKTFLEIAYKQGASTSIESLERYVKGLKLAKTLHGNCPKQEIISALQYCLYCKQLRKIYRSAQGQINQTNFFNLVFKGDPSIQSLLQQSNCPVLTVVKGQLFSFIQYYFGVILEIDEKVFAQYYLNPSQKVQRRRKKDLFFSATSSPLIRQYGFSQLQIMESYSKLPQYFESRHHLTEAALKMKKEVYHLANQHQSTSKSLQLLYDQASFFYNQSDFIGCIKKCKEFEQTCPHQYTKLFPVYLLMMKAYSEFSEADFSSTLRKATDLIQYNYGLQHSSLISLLSLAGFYYFKLSQKPNSSKQVDLSAVAIKLIKKAQEICMKHFGRSSKQFMDILLDLSRITRRSDQTSSLKYALQAKKICEQNVFLATPQNIISLLAYQTEFYLQTGSLPQAESSLLNALTYIDSKITLKTKKHIIKLQYQLGFYLEKYNYCEEAVERLWAMSHTQKLQAVELAYKTALRETGTLQSENLIDENDSARYEGQTKTLVQIQKQKQQFSNLVEMIINAIEQKNTRLLTMIYYLGRT